MLLAPSQDYTCLSETLQSIGWAGVPHAAACGRNLPSSDLEKWLLDLGIIMIFADGWRCLWKNKEIDACIGSPCSIAFSQSDDSDDDSSTKTAWRFRTSSEIVLQNHFHWICAALKMPHEKATTWGQASPSWCGTGLMEMPPFFPVLTITGQNESDIYTELSPQVLLFPSFFSVSFYMLWRSGKPATTLRDAN